METKRLLNKLGRLFPKRIAKENHDFVGLMAGILPEETQKIVLCLDFDEFVLDKLIHDDFIPDLIITHHPFIYGKKKKVFFYDEKKQLLFNQVGKRKLCIYSIHTNFDAGKGGMNDTLAKMLRLENIRQLEEYKMARGGELLAPMSAIELAKYIKKTLGVKSVKVVSGNDNPIKSVAIVGGGGSGGFKLAQKEGYDAYISGDAPHHIRRDVLRYQYNYFDVAHEVERVFMYRMKEVLKEIDSTLEIQIIDHEEEATLV